MQINRISFLSLLFIFCFFSLTLPHKYQALDPDHAKNWSISCAEQMTPQELQFTANFLFLLYANAFIDSEIQRYFAPLLELTCAVRNNLSDPLNSNDELMYLKALVNKIACTTKIRLIHTQMLNACLQYYDQHKNDVVETALKDLQLYASDSLYAWAEQEHQTTTLLLEKSAQKMVASAQNIYLAANFHTGLRNGDLPFAIDEKDKQLAIFNVILKSTPHFMAAIDKSADALNATADHAMSIVCLGAHTYKEHYQALYDILLSDAFDKNYATLLFDTDGLLSPEYRTLLPNTDYIFEYMLQITQLFEQRKV